MKENMERIGQRLGLYDSVTGRSLGILWAVDLQPASGESATLEFGEASHGMIVKITVEGASCVSPVGNLADNFIMLAERCQLSSMEIENIVKREAPAPRGYPSIFVEMKSARTLQQLAQEAINVQDACNLCGVAHGFAKAMSELDEYTNGTEERNRHPISKMWSDKIASLTGTQSATLADLNEAWSECKRLAGVSV
jgi:hypothetical protein